MIIIMIIKCPIKPHTIHIIQLFHSHNNSINNIRRINQVMLLFKFLLDELLTETTKGKKVLMLK